VARGSVLPKGSFTPGATPLCHGFQRSAAVDDDWFGTRVTHVLLMLRDITHDGLRM
jgi:hypothetical protein